MSENYLKLKAMIRNKDHLFEVFDMNCYQEWLSKTSKCLAKLNAFN